MIYWESFTPLTATIGGVLIGIATAALLLLTGHIVGISGIVGGLLRPLRGNIAWRLAFVSGLIAAPACYAIFARLPDVVINAGYPTLIIAGFLVGIGTRYGSGCTSGHGICGLSRLSPRSLVATLAFMIAGFVTVFIVRHLIGFQ